MGVPGAVLLVELAKSLKLCTDPEREVATFVLKNGYNLENRPKPKFD